MYWGKSGEGGGGEGGGLGGSSENWVRGGMSSKQFRYALYLLCLPKQFKNQVNMNLEDGE